MPIAADTLPTVQNLTESEQRWIRLAGCSLATSSKENWIEKTGPGGHGGSLPEYICEVARGIMKSGHSRERAIPMAIGTIRRWATSGRTSKYGSGRTAQVDADTRAKATRALAQWEAMKAKRKAKRATKRMSPKD